MPRISELMDPDCSKFTYSATIETFGCDRVVGIIVEELRHEKKKIDALMQDDQGISV